MTINKSLITPCMNDMNSCCESINRMISQGKKIQPQKGCRLGKIVQVTNEGLKSYWSTIYFPQWVKCEDDPGMHSYQFSCDEHGNFLSW